MSLVLGACASSQACQRDQITGSERCTQSSSDPAEAAATVVAAGVAWGVAGCTINGCEPPFRCNGETKMCERIRCGEGESACPPGYGCDPEDKLCK